MSPSQGHLYVSLSQKLRPCRTAIVWKNWEKQYTLEGHQAAVWAVLAISENEFITGNNMYTQQRHFKLTLTGCADKKIRWFRGEKQTRSVEAHSEPVRGLCKLPKGGFASCSNDGYVSFCLYNAKLTLR